jgi:hypothetical protein
MVNLRFICASYRSLYLKSSLSLLESIWTPLACSCHNYSNLCSIRIIIFIAILQDTYLSKCEYLFIKIRITYSARIKSYTRVSFSVMQDSIPIEWLHACSILFAQCIRFWAGRIKGWSKTRFVPKMNALCVSWLANRILDLGYISSEHSIISKWTCCPDVFAICYRLTISQIYHCHII